jgi:hypothetical protein
MGFLMQSGYISYKYFKYETTTKVTIETKALIRPPTTTFCARYIDLMDARRLRKEKGIRIKQLPTGRKSRNASRKYTATDVHYRQSYLLTVKDIFDYTPATADTLKDCRVRDMNNIRGVTNHTVAGCYSLFNVTKFYMQAFICYNFNPSEAISSFSIEEISHSYRFEMATYGLYLPRKFFLSRTIYLMLGPEKYPHVSRSYGAYMRTMLHLKMITYANDYLIQNKVTSINLLPPPYDSMCFVDHDYSLAAECLIEKMRSKRMDRVPNTEIIRQAYDVRHVLWNDDTNLTMRLLLDESYQECQFITERQKCRYSFSETQVAMAANPDFQGQLRLRAMGPHAPNVLVTSHAQFGASEFFIYVFSCAGIWLGISIVHFNPLLLVAVMLKKAKQYQKHKQLWSWVKVRPTQVVYFEAGRMAFGVADKKMANKSNKLTK